MRFEYVILIISLIFISVLYTVLIVSKDLHTANSFAMGAAAALFDFYALSRSLRSILISGAGWLLVPFGMFRLFFVGVILFIAFYYYKAEPLALALGVAVPVAGIFVGSLYKIVWGSRNGTSS